jgi:hypothetical protein
MGSAGYTRSGGRRRVTGVWPHPAVVIRLVSEIGSGRRRVTRSGPRIAVGEREKGCAGDRGIDRRDGPAERDGLRRMRRSRGLVVPPAPLYAVRAHRLLRLLAVPARERPCGRHRAPAHQELRAGRVVVLELRGGPDVRQRPGACPARAPSRRPAGARPGGPRTTRLAVEAPLTAVEAPLTAAEAPLTAAEAPLTRAGPVTVAAGLPGTSSWVFPRLGGVR